ncbi:MAG: cysteine hydrolase family protein [Candidatus Binataceae bacterium]
MRRVSTALFLSILLGCGLVAQAQAAQNAQTSRGPNTVLVLIDMQRSFLTPNGRDPVARDQMEPTINVVNRLIKAMRVNALPVAYVRDDFSQFAFLGGVERNWAAMRYEGGEALVSTMDMWAGPYFTKAMANAFVNRQFNDWLEQENVGHLAIAGVMLGNSVLASTRAALSRGYKVTVISDAVAARSADARDAQLRKLKRLGAGIETSEQFVSALQWKGQTTPPLTWEPPLGQPQPPREGFVPRPVAKFVSPGKPK